MVFRSFKLKV